MGRRAIWCIETNRCHQGTEVFVWGRHIFVAKTATNILKVERKGGNCHVCAITGSGYFAHLASRYKVPMAVSGFKDKELLVAIYGLVKMAEEGLAEVRNYYPSVVESKGNAKARDKLEKYFMSYNAVWRGIGEVENSGLILREAYSRYDMGSRNMVEDVKSNKACCCGQILMGKLQPKDCPLFGKACSPDSPQGACMVSYEGSCYQHYLNS